MRREMWFLFRFVLLAVVTFLGARSADAVVLYSENFEGFTIDTALPASTSNVGSGFYFVKPTTPIASTPPDGQQKLVVRSASSTGLPDEGLTSSNANWSESQFLEWHDNAATSATGAQTNFMAVGAFAPITSSPFSFSLDFHEPSGFPGTGGSPSGSGSEFTVAIGNTAAAGTTDLNVTANRGVNVVFGDPNPTTSPQVLTVTSTGVGDVEIAYTLDTKHTLQIFGNYNTGGPLTYKGANSVADNTYDVWLDGTRILSGQGFRNSLAQWNSFAFAIGANVAGTDVKYIDNVVMTNDLVGPPSSVAGDYNGNGVVDAADYVLWRKEPTNPANGYVSDPSNGYNTWRANFGSHLGSGSGLESDADSVPEPAGFLLLMAAMVAACVTRGRRS